MKQQQTEFNLHYRNVVNPAYILSSTSLKSELIDYYKQISVDPKSTPVLKFPIKFLPPTAPVYVLGYTKDSLLAEVVCYFDRGPAYATNSVRGWVYTKTLHETPPDKVDVLEPVDLSKVIEMHERQQAEKDSLNK